MPLRFQGCDGTLPTDKRLGRPLCPADEPAPATAWTVITDDPDKARAAVEAGATGVLVPLVRNLEAAGRMAVALSVIEAEHGLGDGDLTLMALIAGPGAALSLPRGDLLPQRTLALGIDRAALVAAAGEAGARTAAGLVTLAAAACGIVSFVANAVADDTSEAPWNDFALCLVASTNPPNGKNRPEP